MGASVKQTPAEQDAQWRSHWAASQGLLEPGEADVEAFCERVAIKMADGRDEVGARWDVALGWESHR